jgi:aminopeptidase C
MATAQDIRHFYAKYPTEKYGILSKISHQHNILDILYGGNGIQNPSPAWTYEVSPGIPPVDQQHTGRCWIFSALTVHNHLFRNQYGINNSKAAFSEGYIGFWDLFEKSRLFLQIVLDHKDDDLDENTSLAEFIKTGVQDGGDYIFAMNIIEKYGVVPIEFYPNRTYGTATTESVLNILNQLLRDNAVTLRQTGDKRKLVPMMHNVFAILVLAFGIPPEPWKNLNWHLEQNEGYNYYASSSAPEQPSTVFEVLPLPSQPPQGEEQKATTANLDIANVLSREREANAAVAATPASSPMEKMLGEINNNTEGTLATPPAQNEEEVDDLSNPDSTVQLENEIEENQIIERGKERKTVAVESPPSTKTPCGRGFESWLSGLVRPPLCSKGSNGGIGGCGTSTASCELRNLAYTKRGGRSGTEKKLEFDYTPIQLCKKFITVTRFTPLLCDPRYPKSTFIIMNDTNMIGGREEKYLNVSMEEMALYAIESLKLNIPVFFAADVKKEITPEGGKLHPDDSELESILPEEHETPKQRQRIAYYNAMATHAMVFSAVSLKGVDKPEWWRAVNSWGDVGVRCGMFILSHDWFKRHVYSINVPTDILAKQHKSLYKKKGKCIYLDGVQPSVI